MIDGVVATMKSGLEKNQWVTNDFNELKKRAENINGATNKQKNAMVEMEKSVSTIMTIVQTTASSSNEIAGSAEELSGMAEMLKSKVDYFKI
jgi:methyl-accepting chemotaxis protein